MNIKFNYQIKDFRIRNSTIVKNWLKNVVTKEKYICGNIRIVFVDDKYLKSINQEFLKHNYYTDVITFDYSVKRVVEGEVYISVETIIDNASEYRQSLRSEVLRVMVHGILHLTGYDDISNEEKKIMREKEDYYLNFVK
ncbi:MAG: rRNA maturation RNase YbeY [Bacteroidales bacterium]|nr:rRNA maturation RNase YbeY [Bacteroidales bacterium]